VGVLLAVTVLGGCGASEPQPEIVPVPTNEPTPDCMDALITGTLVADERWGIALESGGARSKVIWPNGYHGVRDGTVLALVDGRGRLIGRVGDVIESGGGNVGGPDNTVVLCDLKVPS
jgi:hypothetical protein